MAGLQAGVIFESLAEFERACAQPLAPLLLHPDGNFYATANSGGAFGAGGVLKISPTGVLTTIVSFDGQNGRSPVAGLVLGSDGTLQGTTVSGGAGDFGTVFRVAPSGGQNTLLSFTGASGSAPGQMILLSDGALLGLTQAGGSLGFGTVFRVSPTGEFRSQIEFTGRAGDRKGEGPVGLTRLPDGTIFGVTRVGGAGDLGTVFRLGVDGSFSTVVEFTGQGGAVPGASPGTSLLAHSDGQLYGVTEEGGAAGFGLIFRLSPDGRYAVVQEFLDTNGSQPAGTLAEGADGAIFGTTAGGGRAGFGTIFRLGREGALSTLVEFTGETGTARGAVPRAGLVLGRDGSWYGATSAGGAGNLGLFFRVTASGAYSVLAELSGLLGSTPDGAPIPSGNDWLIPLAEGGPSGGGTVARVGPDRSISLAASFGGVAGVQPNGLFLAANAIHGTTFSGGNLDRGVFFRLASNSGATVLHHFANAAGAMPEGPLILGNDGNFHGVAMEGGASGRGTVFRLTPTGTRTRLVSFTGTGGLAKGDRPRGPLAKDVNGDFLGLAERGGANDAGVVFRLSPSGAYTALHEFSASGPRWPKGGLAGFNGQFLGLTSAGGAGDFGTIFRLNSSGQVTVLAEFTGLGGALPGAEPMGVPVVAADGTIYALASEGGTSGAGTLARVKPDGSATTLLQFDGKNGRGSGPPDLLPSAIGGLTFSQDGWLYGTLPSGGSRGGGAFFRVKETANSPLEDWKARHLGDANAPDLADADGDGLSNLVEYGLGLSPERAEREPLAIAFRSALEIIVARDPTHDDISVEAQASDGLRGEWSTIAASINGAPFSGVGYASGDANSPGLKRVVLRDPVAGQRRFLRFQVTRTR